MDQNLDRCTYFSVENDDALVAVGWLDSEHDFPSGPVDLEFFERLEMFARRPWRPILWLRGHECNLCQHQGPISSADLFIPYRGAHLRGTGRHRALHLGTLVSASG